MWSILRIFISLIVSFEIAFSGLFSGVIVKGIEMPSAETGEYTQYVDPFIGTGNGNDESRNELTPNVAGGGYELDS